MKASRLLHLLLLLQTRQRVTTTELAERLEVSRRTILRDVEALSAAGVPVYAERGRNGGIVLIDGARLNASHLDPGELEALSITGADDDLLRRLGLAAAHETAVRKIAAREAAAPVASASVRLADLVLVESAPWLAAPATTTDVAELAWALRRRRRMRIRYRRSSEVDASPVVVDPYGVVAKSGRWYLVADAQGTARLFALERLAAYELLDAPALLRPGRTLRAVWAEVRERTESPGRVGVTVRLRQSRLDLARRILGARIRSVSAPDDGWCTVVIGYPDTESVRQLLQFGDHVEVLAPAAARERIHQLARDLADRHAPGPMGTVVVMTHTTGPGAEPRRLDWAEGTWTHAPAAVRIGDGALRVTAVEGSDAWRHTAYGFVHDSEHALVAPFAAGTSMEVDFGTPLTDQFDQAGIFVRASEERWIKAGIEFADGVPAIGAVVTDGRSDWSAAPAPEWAGCRVTFRISWADDALTIRARREDSAWQLVRLLPFEASEDVVAGPFLCAPTRAGLEVPFYGWRVGAPDLSLH